MNLENLLDRFEAKSQSARRHRDLAEENGDHESMVISQAKADAYDEAYQMVLEER